MTDLQWWRLASEKYEEQHGVCPVCKQPLDPDLSGVSKPHLDSGIWPRPHLAHRVKRSVVVRELGKDYEWDLRVLWLTHPKCNDGAMLGGAHPLAEAELFDEIRGESRDSRPDLLGA